MRQERKVRLSVDCTPQQRMYIKMLATKNHMTISEYLISSVEKDMPQCAKRHEPNEETSKVLRESEKGENLLEHATMDEFWDSLGFNA